MRNALMAILTVAVFGGTLVGCRPTMCSNCCPGDKYGRNDGCGQNTGIPWCFEKGDEWVWEINPTLGYETEYTISVRVIEVEKLVELAIRFEGDGEVLFNKIVQVHASVVPALMSAIAWTIEDPEAEMPSQLEWVRSSQKLQEIYRRAVGRQERQGGGRVQAYTANWDGDQVHVVVGGAIPPDIIMLGSDCSDIVIMNAQLLARPNRHQEIADDTKQIE